MIFSRFENTDSITDDRLGVKGWGTLVRNSFKVVLNYPSVTKKLEKRM